MKRIILIVLALTFAGCFATSGDLETAVADITSRIDVVARDAQASSEAAREAWKRGEIDYAELQKRLQDIRSATLDSSKEITREVVDGVQDAIRSRPGEVIEKGTEAVGGLLPGPWGEILATLGIAASAMYAKKTAQAAAKEEAARVNRERDEARRLRHEPTGGQVGEVRA